MWFDYCDHVKSSYDLTYPLLFILSALERTLNQSVYCKKHYFLHNKTKQMVTVFIYMTKF